MPLISEIAQITCDVVISSDLSIKSISLSVNVFAQRFTQCSSLYSSVGKSTDLSGALAQYNKPMPPALKVSPCLIISTCAPVFCQ